MMKVHIFNNEDKSYYVIRNAVHVYNLNTDGITEISVTRRYIKNGRIINEIEHFPRDKYHIDYVEV